MNLKACTFERLAFISLGFGSGPKSGQNFTFGSGIYFTAQASTLGVFNFSFGTLQAQGEDAAFFFLQCEAKIVRRYTSMGSGPVLRHNNACVRDVLTAPSNVYLNLGLNLFHSYF